MKVGKDVLIPIINSKNPFLPNIKNHNVSMGILALITQNSSERIWYNLPKTQKNELINYYMVNDQLEKSKISNFLSAKQNIEGISVENSENLITAIQNDPYSIGFCKLSNLINSGNDKNITILPVDINANGKIDDFENVYTDLQGFLSKGRYSKSSKDLTEIVYSVALQTPTSQAEIAFLKYISTVGQKYVDRIGYTTLASNEKQSNLEKLGFTKEVATVSDNSTLNALLPYLISGFVLILIIVAFWITPASENKVKTGISPHFSGVFNKASLITPSGLYFDKTHTWAFMEKDGLVGVGIDDFLQHIVGPITRIKMMEPGSKIKKGEPLLTIIQEGKQLTIKAPVSGTIKSQNKELLTNSLLLNNSPYEQGWVYMIEPTNWLVEIEFLIMWQKYNDWLKNEFTRLKDFLRDFVKHEANEPVLVLQDGGELKDGVLVDFGPEVWEDFQTNFIDKFDQS